MFVHSNSDLRKAYELIKVYTDCGKGNAVTVVDTKREIRKYLKRKQYGVLNGVLVKDYGIDGYIEKIELPFVFGDEEAEMYFENNIRIPYYPSQYDCTGKAFTSWRKIFKNSKGRYICYHRVCVDC